MPKISEEIHKTTTYEEKDIKVVVKYHNDNVIKISFFGKYDKDFEHLFTLKKESDFSSNDNLWKLLLRLSASFTKLDIPI